MGIRHRWGLAALACLAAFLGVVALRTTLPRIPPEAGVAVVVPAALQVVLYGGDRYLAADIESMRAAASVGTMRQDEAVFRARAHLAVSELNPCHEDNYWIGNAEMTWGGSQQRARLLLSRAADCRFWDPWPAFFLGFNHYFFERNIDRARDLLENAASRADEKTAAAFRDFSVRILAGQFEQEDARVALTIVRREREQARDAGLRRLLEQRAGRLEGLVVLRKAQDEFVRKKERLPVSAEELVSAGILTALPVDPSGVGYAMVDGKFVLKQLRHEGLESLR